MGDAINPEASSNLLSGVLCFSVYKVYIAGIGANLVSDGDSISDFDGLKVAIGVTVYSLVTDGAIERFI